MAAALAGDRVRLEAIAVLDVRAEDLLERQDADRLHVIRIKRQRTLVIETRLGHADAMKLGFQ